MAIAYPDFDERPSNYGATPYLEDHPTEGDMPLPWIAYLNLQEAQGPALSKDRNGYLHVENLADARMFAGLMHCAERMDANSRPDSADESLGYWVDVLGVSVFPDENKSDIRDKCAARFLLAASNDAAAIERALRRLLGTIFLGITRTSGADLENEPPLTYWKGGEKGPHYLELGEGQAWTSARARLLIRCTDTTAHSSLRRLRLLDIEMLALLSRKLPAWTTWSWCFNTFLRADTGRLDRDALGS